MSEILKTRAASARALRDRSASGISDRLQAIRPGTDNAEALSQFQSIASPVDLLSRREQVLQLLDGILRSDRRCPLPSQKRSHIFKSRLKP